MPYNVVPPGTPSSYDFDALAEAHKRYHPEPNLVLLRKAYDLGQDAHDGQVRSSGEPYFTHPIAVAHLCCELKLDSVSVAAALLHDTLEDCGVTCEFLKKEFGDEVMSIVDGVTKLTSVEFDSTETKQAENFRKMLVAMARDIRVILVKICDRLHNMRTIGVRAADKQRKNAIETEEIYAPLANRLGLYWVKAELQDLSLKAMRPEVYVELQKKFSDTAQERDLFVKETTELISTELHDAGVQGAVSGRAKNIASIWRKMEADNIPFEQVYDLLAFRVMVSSVRACYETLGVIHSIWKPVPNRFKDFIAMPKPNGYQSLHTTVISGQGHRIEIQIRTLEMHRFAEEGIAAHWRYKEGDAPTFDLQWVKELVETQKYLKNPEEFIQSVKSELFPLEVFVFTPKGDLLRLPTGATPIDFAYAVHTDLGSRVTGARVNGVMVPIAKRLENGDTVEVITSKNQVPSKDWLKSVQTSKAKQRIRAFLKAEERARSVTLGTDLLTRELRKVKLTLKRVEESGELLKAATALGLRNNNELFVEIGYGKLAIARVIAKLVPETDPMPAAATPETPLRRIFREAAKKSRSQTGVKVQGFDDLLVRFAKCCEPLPGDRIVGFITRGRGVTVHHAGCQQVLRADGDRVIPVVWQNDTAEERTVRVAVTSSDQRGLLAKLSHAISEKGANILGAQSKADGLGRAHHIFEITAKDVTQLDQLMRAIELVPGVIKVERIKGG